MWHSHRQKMRLQESNWPLDGGSVCVQLDRVKFTHLMWFALHCGVNLNKFSVFVVQLANFIVIIFSERCVWLLF